MPKKTEEVLEAWSSLKSKINALLSDLDSFKANQEVIIERYEKKLRDKSKEFEELEEGYKDLANFVSEVRRKVVNSPNISQQSVLDILNRRK
jgi:archaellum component FlaC